MDNFKIKFTTEVSFRDVYHLLITAREGGMSSCWAEWGGYDIPKNPDVSWLDSRDIEDGKPVFPFYAAPFCGGHIVLIDFEENREYKIDLESIKGGLQTMASKCPRHFSDFVSKNDDAITGDVFLQCCVFGEIVYG